ncbi:hypothetical protein CRUP_032448 [Coryphaenoides rupestris]|nr:hypothetical protein CRUP_032448 [Coryphaenoides rupestris]
MGRRGLWMQGLWESVQEALVGSATELSIIDVDRPGHQRGRDEERQTGCKPDPDLGPDTPKTPEQYPDQPTPSQTPPPLGDPDLPHRSKVDFALKLGYSEDLVLLVLSKLGPQALINDILGELVKLGPKINMEPASSGGSTGSLFSSSSLSSSTSFLDSEDKENLRPVVLDGSNVAMSHGNKEVFSCQGIQLAVDWLLERGHRDITVFVPAWRKEQSRPDALITVVCYDDRFIVKLAYESDGIIVSNDNYRDLANEKPEWKKFIDERLLMYSFVNDKFMPPDDPLGRHGPSLDNFLRKRPILPDHRKQPCPYGKKCTYGHKCKFYHPERGSQPQRAVADELRASAKSSTSASKNLLGDRVMGTPPSLTSSQREITSEAVPSRESPKKMFDPRSFSLSDLLDEQLVEPTKVGRRGSGSSSCSGGSLLGLPAPGGPPSNVSQDRWDHPGGGGAGSSRVVGASGPGHTKSYPTCESPELAYSSLVRAYSSLSLVVPKSPERFSPAGLRAGSLPSECSSNGSVSSDSFSPEPVLEDGLKCPHHHEPHALRHHPHHLCPSRYPHFSNRVSPEKPPDQGYSLSQPLGRPAVAYALDASTSSHPSYSPPLFSPPLPHCPPLQHRVLGSHLGGFPGEYNLPPPTSPQTSSAHAQTSTPSRDVRRSLWQDSRIPDPGLYEGSPLHSRGGYPGMNHQMPQHQHHHQQQEHFVNWSPHYQPQPPHPRYEQTPFHSLPEGRDKAWASPWGRCTHPSPRHLPSAQQSQAMPSIISPHYSHQTPAAAPRQELPGLGVRYQDLREQVFTNLCNIFPQEAVRMVMGRHPQVTDAQQLAAAILVEKMQQGY